MDNCMTLSEIIKELQQLEKTCGNMEVLFIGTCNGQFGELRHPFAMTLKHDGKWNSIYIANRVEDIGKSFFKEGF